MIHLRFRLYLQDILNIARTWCEYPSPKNQTGNGFSAKRSFPQRQKVFLQVQIKRESPVTT